MSDQPDLFSVVYHDTTHLPPDELAQAVDTASHQDDLVLRIFAKAGKPLSPSQVWRIGCDQGERWLLTSVRRSITNLTKSKALQKTGERREGQYGRPEMVWARAA